MLRPALDSASFRMDCQERAYVLPATICVLVHSGVVSLAAFLQFDLSNRMLHLCLQKNWARLPLSRDILQTLRTFGTSNNSRVGLGLASATDLVGVQAV